MTMPPVLPLHNAGETGHEDHTALESRLHRLQVLRRDGAVVLSEKTAHVMLKALYS